MKGHGQTSLRGMGSGSSSAILPFACPCRCVSSSLFVVGGAGAFTAIHWWCVGPHSPYAGSGVGPLSLFISGGLLCPSSLMVWWCGVPHCGSRVVVVVGIPCREGGGWLGWRVLVTCGCSMMVVWWALGIVVVVSPVVKGGGGGGLLSRVVVVVGDGHSWAVVVCMPCCGAGPVLNSPPGIPTRIRRTAGFPL